MEKCNMTGKGMRAKHALIAAALIAASMACGRGEDMEESGEPPYIVDDWEVNPDTVYTSFDSVRDMTREDSIRFGLI